MSYLSRPLLKGRLKLKNRLVMPPMATAKSNEDGSITKDILDYYQEKSEGGYIGLVIIEHSFISRQGKASARQLSISNDSDIEKLKDLADVIHRNGSKAVMQINHAGSAASKTVTGLETVGPSDVPNPFKSDTVPGILSLNEIRNIIIQFKNAALRVKEAGFDGVEIHGAHGYLLNQFMSPLTNKREDEYGINISGRIKLHIDIIKEVRKAAGEDFPILLRLGASDYMEGGITIEDSKFAAKEFEKAGADILDISGGFCRYSLPGHSEPGYFAPLSKAIKESVSIPVIVTGGITEAQAAEDILAEGKADLVGVARAILKDSKWAKKAMENL